MSSNQYLSLKSCLDDNLQSIETSIDLVNFFKWEFQFLDFFLLLQRCTGEPNKLDDVTQRVQTLFQDPLVDLSEVQKNKILLTKMEIKAKYSFPELSLPISSDMNGIHFTKFISEFVHSVAENLPELVKIDDPYSLLYFPETMERVKDVLKELDVLKKFVCFVSARFIAEPQSKSQHHDGVTTFFAHVLTVAGHAAMLFWLYLPELEPEEIRVLLSDFLLMRIKPIQPCTCKIYVDVLQSLKSTILESGWYPHIQDVYAESSFLETILHSFAELPTNSNSRQIVALKDPLVILQKMLNLLRANANRVLMQDLDFLRDINTLIIDVGILVYSLYNSDEVKEVVTLGELNTALVLDMMGSIQHTNTVICLTIRKAFQSNLPSIHGIGYVDFLLSNLKEFQARYADSLAPVMKQLQIIQKELESSQPFLQVIAEERFDNLDKIQRCATQLIGKAYEIEYIVDACIRDEAPVWCLERWLLDIREEITLINAEVAEIHEIHEKKMVVDGRNVATAPKSESLENSSRMDEEIVGFKEVIEKLRDQLTRGTRGRDVISIVGMPGLGKTTLAYRLYNDRSVVSYFDVRAQCCVSQVYSRKDLLLAILRDVGGDDIKSKVKPADKLADDLRRALIPKRYLVLLDDMWEASAWDDLRGCFTDQDNGSRIILTTRNHDVADYARFRSEPILLRMLSDDESWELLSKKVFGEESCPPLLTNIGRRIARKCGQLPLSVILVAGILAKMEKKAEYWEQLAEDLGPLFHNDSRVIIETSYQHLPYHLKSCFLYFGAFLEDSAMNVSKLMLLWISEGFIKSCNGKSLEDVAEGYLENLIGRNLVMRSKKGSGGRIKTCQIHDLLHHFCQERAKEENLLVTIKWDQSCNSSSRVDYHKQLAHRMSIYGDGYGYDIVDQSSHWSHVSSVISHINCNSFDFSSHIFLSFKFLKVLDWEFTDIDYFPTNLDLVYLRYFAARTRDLSIISSMTICWNLETLILDNAVESTLPITIWGLVKLRHLHISRWNSTVENAEELLDNSKTLDGLETLSTPYFSFILDAELFLGKTPNLRKLKCKVLGSLFDYESCVFNFSTRIETLKVQEHIDVSFNTIFPFCISAPNLRKLTVDCYYLHPRHISGIGLLQNLQILKLQRIIFWNKGWKVRDDEFPQLKVLKLNLVDFQGKWTVSDDAFPNLEHLVLDYCDGLKKIPSCFGELPSLKSIEVKYCKKRVCDSAREIAEIQEGYERSDFQVLIIDERKDFDSGPINDDEDDDEHDDGYDDTTLDRTADL